MLNPTVIAVPLFALLIGLEYWYDVRQKTKEYETTDTFTNIGLGFVSLFFGAVFGIIQATVYNYLYTLAPYEVPMTLGGHGFRLFSR